MSTAPEPALDLASRYEAGIADYVATGDRDGALAEAFALGREAIDAGLVLHTGHSPSTKLIRGRAGIVGGRLPKLHTETLTLGDGDVILLASDGISPNFARLEMAHLSLQRLVDEILASQGMPTDDALVVAARYRRAGA